MTCERCAYFTDLQLSSLPTNNDILIHITDTVSINQVNRQIYPQELDDKLSFTLRETFIEMALAYPNPVRYSSNRYPLVTEKYRLKMIVYRLRPLIYNYGIRIVAVSSVGYRIV